MNDLIRVHLEWMPGASYAPKSIRDRGIALRTAHARLPRGVDDVYPHEIATYLRSPHWSRWTAHTNHAHLAGFYRWAYAEGYLSLDPMAGMRPPPAGAARPKPITAAELRTVLERSEDPWLTAAVLAVGAGLRASELAQIRREDITEDYVHVRCGKGGRERYVDTCAAVWRFVRDRPRGALVRRAYGRPVTAAWLSAAQRRHWLSIGLPGMHWHRLRHTFATTMHQAGADALVLRDLMGHSSVSTTQMYVTTAPRQRRNAVSAVDDLIGEARASL